MIKQGKYGSFNLFYNGKLISSYGIHRPNFTDADAVMVGEDVIRGNKNIPITKLIQQFKLFCEITYQRKIQKKGIRRSDHKLFTNCLLALIRLGVVKNDDFNGFLICPRRKKRSIGNRPPIHHRH